MAYQRPRRVLPLPQTAPQFAMQQNRPPPSAQHVGGTSSTTQSQPQQQQQQSPLGSPLTNAMAAMRIKNMLAGKPIAGVSSSGSVSGAGAVAPAGGDLGYAGSQGRVLQVIPSPNATPGAEIGGSPASTGMPEVAGAQGRYIGGSVSPVNEMPIQGPGQVTMSELPAPSGMGINAGSAIGGAEGGMMGPEIGLLGQSGGFMGPEIGMAGAGGGGMIGPEIGMAGAEMFGPSMAELGGMGGIGIEAGGLGIGGAEAGSAGLAAAGEGVAAGAGGGAMAAGGGGAAAGGAASGAAGGAAGGATAAGMGAIPIVGWAALAALAADKVTGGQSTNMALNASGLGLGGNPENEGDYRFFRDGGLGQMGAPDWVNPQNWIPMAFGGW